MADLADRVERLRVTAVLVCGDELFVGIAADFPTELAARAWRVVADDSARTRLERWLEDANAPQAYRSADGAIVMADRVWGGNVECEPAVSVC